MSSLFLVVMIILLAVFMRVKIERRLQRINKEVLDYRSGLRDNPPKITWFDEIYYRYPNRY